MTQYLAGPETICPTCDREYARISQHWAKSSCDHPTVTRTSHDFLTGLLLGGGSVQGNSANKYTTIGTRHRPLADWLYTELDWLAHSLRRVDPPGEQGQFYRVRTHAHPALTAYRQWYVDGRKRLPERICIDLNSRGGRVWWALAGGLQWSDPEYATTRQATVSALDDDRAARITAILEDIGLEPTRAGKRVQLPPKQTTAWLEWIGPPVPGVEYKWAADHQEYRTAKRDAEAIRATLAYNAASEPEW